MAAMTAGEIVVKCLAQEKVRVIFAVPDVAYNPILGKLKEHGIRLVPPRHEAAAAHMADGWSRATGEPGVCMAGAGPGTANLLSGIITATAEGSPGGAITAKPGPVQLDIPEDVIYAEVDEAQVMLPTPEHYRVTQPLAADPALVKEAAALLTAGELPAIY